MHDGGGVGRSHGTLTAAAVLSVTGEVVRVNVPPYMEIPPPLIWPVLFVTGEFVRVAVPHHT